MASANAPPSSIPIDPGDGLHPSLLGIAAAIEQSENERKQRLGLAQAFLTHIDAWAKTRAETEEAALVAPLMERIAPIVTAFAIGSAHTREPPCKTPFPKESMVTTATPRATKTAEKPNLTLPERPQGNKSPWVTVARRAAKLPPPAAPHKSQRRTTLIKPATQSAPRKDKRIFLRLGPQHEWRKLSPVTLKKIITERAGVAASAITAMYSVRSGFALECVSDALRDAILSVGTSFEPVNAKIEPAYEWFSVIVPQVPLYIRTLEVRILVTSEMVANECLAVSGAAPEPVRPNKTQLGRYSTSWLVHFKQKPSKLRFRLFDESGPAMPFMRRRPIEQCQRCWGFHSTRFCTKSSCCRRCNGRHESTECDVPIPKFSNCAGPHESIDVNRMARPQRQNGTIVPRTPVDLRIIRERGHRDFNAAVLKMKCKGKAVEVVAVSEATMQD